MIAALCFNRHLPVYLQIVNGMKNHITLTEFVDFKLAENSFIYNLSAAMCLQWRDKTRGFGSLTCADASKARQKLGITVYVDTPEKASMNRKMEGLRQSIRNVKKTDSKCL